MNSNIRDPYFIFKGIDSRKMGIVFVAVNERVKSEKRVKAVEVPGRDGALHLDDGSRKNYPLDIECIIENNSRRDEILAWLDGSGELILSTDLSKVYKVRIDNKISVEEMMHYFNKFMVTFDVYPYAFSTNKFDDMLELKKPSKILSKGTAEANPVITVYGSGRISLIINGIVYSLSSVLDYVTIDSEMMEVYKDSINESGIYEIPENTDEIFPVLKKGENEISWTGSVRKIVIEPNWRWV